MALGTFHPTRVTLTHHLFVPHLFHVHCLVSPIWDILVQHMIRGETEKGNVRDNERKGKWKGRVTSDPISLSIPCLLVSSRPYNPKHRK